MHFLWCCRVLDVEVSYLSLNSFLMHLKRTSNAKTKNKTIALKEEKRQLLQQTNKEVDFGRTSLWEKKEERRVTEQYAQHKVQAGRPSGLIEDRKGREGETTQTNQSREFKSVTWSSKISTNQSLFINITPERRLSDKSTFSEGQAWDQLTVSLHQYHTSLLC